MGKKTNETERRQVIFNAPVELYEKFEKITSRLGISNTAAINIMISGFVRENSDLIGENTDSKKAKK